MMSDWPKIGERQYRIVRDDYAGYAFEMRTFWRPFWREPRSNTYTSSEKAAEAALLYERGVSKEVVCYLDFSASRSNGGERRMTDAQSPRFGEVVEVLDDDEWKRAVFLRVLPASEDAWSVAVEEEPGIRAFLVSRCRTVPTIPASPETAQ